MTKMVPPFVEPHALAIGVALPPVVRTTSTVQLFRYSAATWNTHRIHYDQEYAAAEGYPAVLVQSHLHGAFVAQYCTDWGGPDARLLELSIRVRRFAAAGDDLELSGTIVAVSEAADERVTLTLEIVERRLSDGEVCVPATARIEVPQRWLGEEESA
jgi:hydroxyacyl-ACP dehydratase HTD2-like protein with hotdog domain